SYLAFSCFLASSRSVCSECTLRNFKINARKLQQKGKTLTLILFSNCNLHVSSSTCFSSLFLASWRAPVSLAACV
ncbi:hypothetical protein N665_0074s0122, partial [Sinapis alba]